jgi:hypothetical protein
MNKVTAAVCFVFLICISAAAQNTSLNILTGNSGKVRTGGSVFLEVTVCNHDAAIAVPAYKLKPQISFPKNLVTIPATGHRLPEGWTVTAIKGQQIWLSNGTDTLPPGSCRSIFINLIATAAGGPSTVSANMLFSNGRPPGFVTGSPVPGDSPADNSSTSTIEVTGK